MDIYIYLQQKQQTASKDSKKKDLAFTNNSVL